MKKITYKKAALKYIYKMPANWRKRVFEKIEQYAKDPDSLSANVIRMTGEPYYRLRVGDYRIVFDENNTIIEIVRVDARGRVYN
ncbi:MAG: type II toxin-antitoxin system RelE/ParE family toxin [Pasteurella sp.]|nr:type II toxin-antitoxin system RelE/ParE family toxin [Pasteurella sp.]